MALDFAWLTLGTESPMLLIGRFAADRHTKIGNPQRGVEEQAMRALREANF
jgi:hypothetical protein